MQQQEIMFVIIIAIIPTTVAPPINLVVDESEKEKKCNYSYCALLYSRH